MPKRFVDNKPGEDRCAVVVWNHTTQMKSLVMPKLRERVKMTLLSAGDRPVEKTKEGIKYGAPLSRKAKFRDFPRELRLLTPERPLQTFVFDLFEHFTIRTNGVYKLVVEQRMYGADSQDLTPLYLNSVTNRIVIDCNPERYP